jgi:hypothetical protein
MKCINCGLEIELKNIAGVGEVWIAVDGRKVFCQTSKDGKTLQGHEPEPTEASTSLDPLCKRCNQPRSDHGEEQPYDLVYGDNKYCESFSYINAEREAVVGGQPLKCKHCHHAADSHDEEFGNCGHLGLTKTGHDICKCPGYEEPENPRQPAKRRLMRASKLDDVHEECPDCRGTCSPVEPQPDTPRPEMGKLEFARWNESAKYTEVFDGENWVMVSSQEFWDKGTVIPRLNKAAEYLQRAAASGTESAPELSADQKGLFANNCWGWNYLMKLRNAIFATIPEELKSANYGDDELLAWPAKLAALKAQPSSLTPSLGSGESSGDCPAEKDEFLCTLGSGHKGDHEAGGSEPLVTWANDPSSLTQAGPEVEAPIVICDCCGSEMLDRGGFYDCFACGHNKEK